MKPIQMLAVAKQGHPTFTFFLLKVAEKGKEFQAQRQEALQAYWWKGFSFFFMAQLRIIRTAQVTNFKRIMDAGPSSVGKYSLYCS